MKHYERGSLFGPAMDSEEESIVAAAQAGGIARVALDSGADRLFDYAVGRELSGAARPGCRVRVPVGRANRLQVGFVVERPTEAAVERLKRVVEVLDEEELLDEAMLRLARWVSEYYCSPLGQVLAAMVPGAVKKQVGMRMRRYVRLADGGEDARLSVKGRAAVAYLEGQRAAGREEVAIEEVAREVGTTKAPIETLARSGVVEVQKRGELEPDETGAWLGESATNEGAAAERVVLNADQEKVLGEIERTVAAGRFAVELVHGVTGSGKTEIYIRAIERVVAAGKQALVLVPEISLTPQTLARFLARFERVAILHSGLTATQRHAQWRRVAAGEADVVVGARSAVFAPLARLGLIVVDEEHEGSYKQDTTPRYHARDVACKRAMDAQAVVVLGSATPSLESLHNCRTKEHYRLLQLPRRVLELPMPPVQVVDLRQEYRERKGNSLLSRAMEAALKETLGRGRQAILLLNRRGHSRYIFCPSCDFVLTCPHCDVGLTCHKTQRQFEAARTWVMCHYCGHRSELPRLCAVCGQKLRLLGPGTQQAHEELEKKFPEARFCRVDSDAVRPAEYPGILSRFGRGEIDVLMGTQMIGKGLDYPNVSLVGVLNADTALAVPDWRSSERTFQLISQVAGRCGRASADSRVVVQTFLPDDPAVALACRHDFETFARQELGHRERAQLPPFHRWARILLRDRKIEKVEAAARRLREGLDVLVTKDDEVSIVGPTPAALGRLEGYYRWQVLLHAVQARAVQRVLGQFRQELWGSVGVMTVVDVDPVNLL